ncbi:hypothetical protein V1477_007630, partial [Vespula maculifrons]
GRRCISYTVQWGSTVRGKNTLFSTGYSGRKGSNGACSIQKGVGEFLLVDMSSCARVSVLYDVYIKLEKHRENSSSSKIAIVIVIVIEEEGEEGKDKDEEKKGKRMKRGSKIFAIDKRNSYGFLKAPIDTLIFNNPKTLSYKISISIKSLKLKFVRDFSFIFSHELRRTLIRVRSTTIRVRRVTIDEMTQA